VLINVGTLEKRKNQLGLIDAFAETAAAFPQARLLLVGDGPHREEVRRRIAEHGLTDKVQMLGMRRDVPALLPVADLYVHYSSLENCPVVLIEAARAGLPIAAVPSGGVPELLEALGGQPIDSSSPQTASQSFVPLLSNANLRRQIGQATRQAFHATFTREAMVAAYLKALNLPAPLKNGEVG
jgi:glycosyltransferase involved in cell wall biosynthesis